MIVNEGERLDADMKTYLLALGGLARGRDDTEQAFGVGAIHPLFTACRLNTKGVAICPHPLASSGSLRRRSFT